MDEGSLSIKRVIWLDPVGDSLYYLIFLLETKELLCVERKGMDQRKLETFKFVIKK